MVWGISPIILTGMVGFEDMSEEIDQFERDIVRKSGANHHQISCRLGLWCVTGRDAARVEGEARHYWIQYFNDGEYAMADRRAAKP